MEHWLKQARKTISEIPKDGNEQGWTLADSNASVKFVTFTFVNNNHQKCYVIIDRTQTSIGT